MNLTVPPNKSPESCQSTAKKNSLQSKLLSSSIWVLLGHSLSQAIRLGGNLVLTRLLFPEAFGLMALVSVVLLGVNAISDVGLRGNIVHNPRADEQSYLNTAWTIQVIRGGVMFLLICLFAWPAAIFFKAPQLRYLLPVIGIAAIIDGFSSTSLATLIKHVALRSIVLREIGSQIAGLILMILCAYIWRSVWALVAGAIFRQFLLTFWSHYLIPGYKNNFAFDREIAKEIYHFGKWLFLSTLMTFAASQGDRIALGKMLTSAELGVYSIAFFLSSAVVMACEQLAHKVLFPTYTQLATEGTLVLRKETLKIKSILYLITLPVLCILSIFGQQIVGFLYDARYKEAGWMLQILAVRSIAQIVIATTSLVLMANGDTFRHMILQLMRVILLGAGMSVGFIIGDITGLLIGMSGAAFLEYIVMSGLIRKYGAWVPELDIPSMALAVAIIYICIFLI